MCMCICTCECDVCVLSPVADHMCACAHMHMGVLWQVALCGVYVCM